MDIRQLRHFAVVARLGSLSRAATELRTAQPSLSRHISLLEQEISAQLLYRTGRGVSLTPAGSRFLERVHAMLGTLDDGLQELQSEDAELTGTLSFGFSESIGTAIAAPVIRAFSETHPHVTLSCVSAYTSTLLEWLAMGRLDIVVANDRPSSGDLVRTPLLESDLFVVGSPFDTRDPDSAYDVDECCRLPLILPTPPHGTRVLFDDFARAHAVTLRPVLEIDNLHVKCELIKRGVGYGIIPYVAVREEVRAAGLSIWPLLPAATARLECMTATSRKRGSVVEAFVAALEHQARLCAANDTLVRAYRPIHT